MGQRLVQSTYYSVSPPSNPSGPASGTYKELRGGGIWYNDWYYLRVAARYGDDPDGRSTATSASVVGSPQHLELLGC